MGFGSSSWKGWVLDEALAIPVLKRALDCGITFYDMADWYSAGRNEEVVGRNLVRLTQRDRLVLATKAFYPMSEDPNDRGLSRKHLFASIDASLRRLGTDYVDIYMVHAFDPETPVEETMEALHDIVKAGKARYLGASTMYAWQFAKMNYTARSNGWTPFANMQCQYNLLYREEEREMIPFCEDQGIAVTAFSPLARGYLTGSIDMARSTHDLYLNFYGDEIDREIVRRVVELAKARGVTPAHVATAWVTSNAKIAAPLIGAASADQVDIAVEAASLTLEPQERAYLEEPYRPRDVINDQNPIRRPRALGRAE